MQPTNLVYSITGRPINQPVPQPAPQPLPQGTVTSTSRTDEKSNSNTTALMAGFRSWQDLPPPQPIAKLLYSYPVPVLRSVSGSQEEQIAQLFRKTTDTQITPLVTRGGTVTLKGDAPILRMFELHSPPTETHPETIRERACIEEFTLRAAETFDHSIELKGGSLLSDQFGRLLDTRLWLSSPAMVYATLRGTIRSIMAPHMPQLLKDISDISQNALRNMVMQHLANERIYREYGGLFQNVKALNAQDFKALFELLENNCKGFDLSRFSAEARFVACAIATLKKHPPMESASTLVKMLHKQLFVSIEFLYLEKKGLASNTWTTGPSSSDSTAGTSSSDSTTGTLELLFEDMHL